MESYLKLKKNVNGKLFEIKKNVNGNIKYYFLLKIFFSSNVNC